MIGHQLSHVQCRCTSQLQIVTNKLYEKVKHVQKKHWREGLAYLTHHFVPQADFRSTLITRISFRLEAEILHTFHGVLECCVEASKQPTHNLTADADSTATWLLAATFERLVLAPDHDTKRSINRVVHERMRCFRSGQTEKLFQETRMIKSKSPRDQAAYPRIS